MALFRRFFYRKPPDHLLEISERVFVFDCCFSMDVLEEDAYKSYMGGIVAQLQDYYPDSSFMVFNVKEGGDKKTQISDILSEYDMKVMEYPWQYEGCLMLPLDMINNFLQSSENWISFPGQKNVLLMHCERGGWPVLAFMLAGLLLFRKQYTGEQKTLEMVYKQAPHKLLQLLSPLNPQSTQLRYLQYITKGNLGLHWPPEEAPLALDCVILRVLPLIGGMGCRPIIRIYGQDPFSTATNKSCELLFSTSNTKNRARYYRMDECQLAKIDVHYRVQGDVVLECVHLDDDDNVKEEILFRVVFHTAFIRGYVLMLGRDEVDLMWDARDEVPKDFKAEVLFVDADPLPSIITTERVSADGSETTGSGSPDEFFEVEEIFSNAVDHHALKGEAMSFFEDDISGSEVCSHSSQDRPSFDDANEYQPHEADPSLQSVEEVDFKPTIVKDIDLTPTIVEYVDLKSTVKSDDLVEEIKVIKDKEDNQRVKKVESTSNISRKSSGNLKKKSPTGVRYAKPNVVSRWIPSNKGSYTNSMHVYYPYARHNSAPPVLKESKLGEKVVEGKRGSGKQASCPPSLDVQRVKKPYDGSLQLRKSVKNIIKSVEAPSQPLNNSATTCLPPAPPPPLPTTSTIEKPVEDGLVVPPTKSLSPKDNKEAPPPPTPESKAPQVADSVCENASPPLPPRAHEATSTPLPPPPPPPPPMYEAPAPPPPSIGRLPISSSIPTAPPPPPLPGGGTPPPPPSMHGTPPPLPPPMHGAPSPPPLLMYGAPPPPPPSMHNVPPSPPPPGGHITGPPPPPGAPPAPPLPGGAPPPPPLPRGAPPPPPLPGRAPAPPPLPGGAPPPRGAPGLPPPPGTPGPPPPPRAPGLPGGPPPPPGRLGGPGRGRGRGVPPVKKSNLKPLHWNKVTRALQGSLWEELQKFTDPQSSSTEFDVSELEKLFSVVVPKKTNPKDAEKKKASSSKPEKVQLIDLRRANNTEIMLTKVKMPLPDITDAILAMDDTLLDVDQVENILKYCPTKEEMEQLKNFTGDVETLGKCEQYFLELMKVPRMETKLNVFLFKIQFNTQLAEFKKSLNVVNSACDEVRKSLKLKEIMKRILYLGNTLNQGTARGAAVGFKLDSLLKLNDTRSSTSKMTLMHYLCKVLAQKAPALLDFHKDLVSLEAATKIQLKILAEEMQALISGLKKVKLELDACANDGPISEGFHRALKEFIGHAEAEVTSVTNFYSVVGRNADALALYFGEDPARCPFEQATLTLLNFVRLFRKSDEENCKLAEAEKKKAEKEMEMEKAKGIKKDS